MLFFANDQKADGMLDLYSSDGTDTGTHVIANVPRVYSTFKNLNGTLYIFLETGQMLQCDGTKSGTKELNVYGMGLFNNYSTIYHDKMYFFCGDSVIKYYNQLWVSDGTDTGTRVIRPSKKIYDSTMAATSFGIINDKMYFGASFDKNKYQLWSYSTPNPFPINGASGVCANSSVSYTVKKISGIAYTWSVSGGTINSGQGTDSVNITWNPRGNGYIKTFINYTGYSDSTEISVSIDTTCVWPGDANNDKVVDNKDLLNIGVGFNKTGPARTSATIGWYGQICKNWADTFSKTLNYKFADCNGDSTIDYSDTIAIRSNYSKVHPKTFSSRQGTPTDPPLYFKFSKDTILAGDTLTVHVMCGSGAIPVTNIYGLAFSILYNPSLLENISEDFNQSWISKKNLAFTFANSGLMDMAIVRINHTDTSGYGELMTLHLKIAGALPVGITPLLLSFTENLQVNSKLEYVPVYLNTDSIMLKNLVSGISKVEKNISLTLSPNPASDKLIIETYSLQEESGSFIIYSANGLEMTSKTIGLSKGENKTYLDISNFPSGIYILQIKNPRETQRVKFIKVY